MGHEDSRCVTGGIGCANSRRGTLAAPPPRSFVTLRRMWRPHDATLADDPFIGFRVSSGVQSGLFKLEPIGVSTEPLGEAKHTER